MATVTFAQALSKYRIAIAPVLRRRGSTSWLAGLRVVNGDGLTNIIDPNRKVEGRATPEDALRDLLVLIGSEDVDANVVVEHTVSLRLRVQEPELEFADGVLGDVPLVQDVLPHDRQDL